MRHGPAHRLPDYTFEDTYRCATHLLRSRGVNVEVMHRWQPGAREECDRRVRAVLKLADNDKVLAADERVQALRFYLELREVRA
jgi:hypothetical protein